MDLPPRQIHPIVAAKTLKACLMKSDPKCHRAHRILNRIAIAEVTDPSILSLSDEARKAIAYRTAAREMLHDLADEPVDN